jgi:hypothetical protein
MTGRGNEVRPHVAAMTRFVPQPGATKRIRQLSLGFTLTWLMVAAFASGQQPAAADPFESIAFLVGRWEGTSEGQPGKATVRREYARAMNARFIRVHNRSEYARQDFSFWDPLVFL